MTTPFQSRFGYSISRQYPYRWFTPVVVIGGIVVVILLSLLNFSSNSVVFHTVLTTNTTYLLKEKYGWFDRAPWSWRRDLNMRCEESSIALGTRIFTSNNGMFYTLDGVLDKSGAALPSLNYKEYPLQDCNVSLVDIQFMRADTSAPGVGWWSWRFTDATVTANCLVETNKVDGPRFANFTSKLGSHPEDIDFIINKADVVTPAKWWGASITQAYYMLMTDRIARLSPQGEDKDAHSIDYMRARLRPRDGGSFENRNFFDVRYQWQLSSSGYRDTEWKSLGTFYNDFNATICGTNHCWTVPAVTNEVEGFASGLYSLAMIDLGQIQKPNMLTNADLLQRYLSGEGNQRNNTKNRGFYNGPSSHSTRGVDLTEAWDAFPDLHDVSSTAAADATLYAQYTCSVPEKRSGITVFLSLLIADMVFLSALWAVLNWVTGWHLQRTGHKVMFCEGHFDAEDGYIQGHGMANLHSYGSSETAFTAISQDYDIERDRAVRVGIAKLKG